MHYPSHTGQLIGCMTRYPLPDNATKIKRYDFSARGSNINPSANSTVSLSSDSMILFLS